MIETTKDSQNHPYVFSFRITTTHFYISADSAKCVVTGDSFFKTFDDKFFMFPGKCTYELVSDCQDQTFRVHVHVDPTCTNDPCMRFVTLYFGADTKVTHFFLLIQGAPREAVVLVCFHKEAYLAYLVSLRIYYTFSLIGNLIFHLSLELLTKFWKTSLKVA